MVGNSSSNRTNKRPSLDKIHNALAEWKQGDLSLRAISKKHNISLGTVCKYRKLERYEELKSIAAASSAAGGTSSSYTLPPVSPVSKINNSIQEPESLSGHAVFSKEVEKMFVENLKVISEMGVPISVNVMKLFVQAYLKVKNRTVRSFTDGGTVPRIEWVRSFKVRHSEIASLFLEEEKPERLSTTNEMVVGKFGDLESFYVDEID